MSSTIAKIGIGLGLVVVAISLFKNKAQQVVSQFSEIAIIPIGVKNFNGKWNNGKPNVSFNIDLNFINPTPTAFSVDGVVLTLKKLVFYDQNGIYIGETNLNMSSLSIAAKSSTAVRNVPISLDLQTTLMNAITIVNSGGFDLSKIKTEVIISILGMEYKAK
ncbi:hypothetical protein [Flavobacterium laiguense]|uniref:Late embryogenesis abundant protein LEA-2 subgroup domain-containing protein n=1 Tax=Flavobacterium laiguense TaxID=2169409 RepID=A0A2U1JWC1_9FLAO|nr:hypothetical protein [Flavobacterium laiguense]PWA09510.1 hypothetical protein DB891_07450 [Flavobacterium laiguense]